MVQDRMREVDASMHADWELRMGRQKKRKRSAAT
jgi:hypothetical protein